MIVVVALIALTVIAGMAGWHAGDAGPRGLLLVLAGILVGAGAGVVIVLHPNEPCPDPTPIEVTP